MREDYKAYMDSLSVDPALHGKIMKRLRHKPNPKPAIKRSLAVVASAALIAACIWAIPLALPQDSPLPLDIPTFSLIFNPTESVTAAKKYIPGYFTQELTQDEVVMLLGEDSNAIQAVAGFSGEGILDEIAIVKPQTTIILAIGPVFLDYIFPDEPEVSNFDGVAVTAGHWTNNEETLYYASFVHGDTGYHIQSHAEDAKEQLTALVKDIISNEPVDLSIIQPNSISD